MRGIPHTDEWEAEGKLGVSEDRQGELHHNLFLSSSGTQNRLIPSQFRRVEDPLTPKGLGEVPRNGRG